MRKAKLFAKLFGPEGTKLIHATYRNVVVASQTGTSKVMLWQRLTVVSMT